MIIIRIFSDIAIKIIMVQNTFTVLYIFIFRNKGAVAAIPSFGQKDLRETLTININYGIIQSQFGIIPWYCFPKPY
jgi:hypothetical protein